MNPPLPEYMIDIEALGKVPGSAILEIGAVRFNPFNGFILSEFEIIISPQSPFTIDLDTLEWHAKQGTYPRPPEVEANAHAIGGALYQLGQWIGTPTPETRFWSWGSTYDFPLLNFAYEFTGEPQPWEYYQPKCARTIWDLAFPGIRHSPRPHIALADAKAAAGDLTSARLKIASKPIISPCPHCHRILPDVPSHIATDHPEFSSLKTEN